MPIQDLESFFTSGARSAGYRFFSDGKVSISQPSDTEITAYVKPSFKVSLKSPSVEDSTLFAACSCPDFKKGRLCKHAWAAVLGAADKSTDFLENKSEIKIRVDNNGAAKPSFAQKPKTQAQTEASAAYKAKQDEYRKQLKEKQSLYRKIQYQKQKLRKNDYKKSKKESPDESEFPRDVEMALGFFSQNGFELKESMNKETLATAKKRLARIFHPDLGGTHEEILELNRCSDILMSFINKMSK